MPTITDDRLLTRTEAAALLGMRPQTLAWWSCTGRNDLPTVRLSARAIRYRRSDIEAFITSRVVRHTSKA